MNKLFCRLVVLILAGWVLSAAAAPRVGHVFIISIDGGKPAVIAKSSMPALKKMAAEGAYTWAADTIFPSITLPAHTSMLTGVGPGKHKVLWNEWIPSNGLVTVPTIFSLAKPAGFTTGMFVGKEKFRHLDIPGSLDVFDFNPADSTNITKTMAGDAQPMKEDTVLANKVALNAARYIVQQKPSLCFIHFTDTDNAGHKYGWGSPEQIKAFADVDAALQYVLRALYEAEIANDSVIIITADHGGHDRTHGLNIPDDMKIPWIVWGKGVKKNFEITAPVVTYDTAATALWLLDIPRPDNLDGKPVTSAFE